MHRRILYLLLTGVLLSFGFFIVTPLPTQAATLTVLNINDSGAGSLRETIANAGSGDSIVFSASIPLGSTITLSSQLVIDKTLTIDGSVVSGLIISGGGSVRVFDVTSGVLTLQNLAVTGGSAPPGEDGGCIRAGSIHLTNVAVSNCQAARGGGMYVSALSTISSASFSTNNATSHGGAIYAENAALTILNNTLFSGNTAVLHGGAIYSDGGSASITDASFSDNYANSMGGANGDGGAFYGDGSLGTITTSTMSGNHAEDGGAILLYNSADLTLNAVELLMNVAANFGGGILALDGSTLDVENSSLIDSNEAMYGGGIALWEPTTTTITDSTVSGNTSHFSGGGIAVDGSLTVTNSSIINNQSDDRNGGLRITTTAIVILNSSHVDDNHANTLYGGGIGMTGTLTVNGGTINSNSARTDGGGIQVIGGMLTLSGVTIQGNHADSDSNSSGSGGGINIVSGATVIAQSGTVIGGVSLQDGNGAYNGGGIANAGSLTLDAASLSTNAAHFGGGLYQSGSGTLISQSGTQFTGNASVLHGGGIYNVSTGTTTISATTFSANIANSSGGNNADGGAYYGEGSTATITSSIMSDNHAEDGGAILLYASASLTLNDVDLVHNIATGYGGGIFALDGSILQVNNTSSINQNEANVGGGITLFAPATATIDATTFDSNQAVTGGGGIASAGAFTLTNSLIQNNNGGTICGGGIIHYGTTETLTVTNTIIADNEAANNGGGICDQAVGATVLINGGTQITGNQADVGAGINGYDNTTIIITDSTVSGNIAHVTGGGIGTGGTLTVTNSSIVDNQSDIRSGGLRIAAAGNVTLNSSHVDRNHADTEFGGGIGLSGTLIVNGGTISDNWVVTDGGGIHVISGSVTLNGVTLQGNRADSDSNGSGNGGALNILSAGVVTVQSGTLIGGLTLPEGNIAYNGGGIYNAGTLQIDPTAQITYNGASGNGGGIFSSGGLNINRILLDHNTAAGSGGGLYLETGASGYVANSLFTYNNAAVGGGAYSTATGARVINDTFYGNSSGLEFANPADIVNVIAYGNTTADCTGGAGAQNSLIGTGTCATNGVNGSVVGFDPLFVNAAGGDFSLNSTSPAIDGGNDADAVSTAGDYAGSSRVQGAAIDIGALESSYENVIGITAPDDIASEDGTDSATFTLSRTGNTAGELTVTLAVTGTASPSDYSLVHGALSYTGTPFTVTFPANELTFDLTVTGIQDLLLEGSETLTLTLADGANYNLTAQSVATANIIDDDAVGITVSQTLGSTNVIEAGTPDSFTISLNSIPSQPVIITLLHDPTDFFIVGDPDGSVDVTLDAVTLSQQIDVQAVNDSFVEGLENGTITFTVASTDASYNGITLAPIMVGISDNDTASISFEQATGTAPEAVSPYTTNALLTITSDPAGGSLASTLDVVITQTPSTASTPADYALITTLAQFPAGAGDAVVVPISVTITDDDIDEADEFFALGFGAVTGAGSASGTQTVTIIDNDAAGVTITPNSGLVTTEAGGGASFNVVLASQPTADVTVSFLSSDTSEGNVPASITFTSVNWSTAQTVAVTGVDDFLMDGDIPFTIVTTVSSSDPIYNGIVATDVSVTNQDNDTAGVQVNAAGILTTTEAGGTAAFTVVLTSQPAADVIINMVSSDTSEGTVPTAIIFTSLNWNNPQTVTITGVDDLVADGNINYAIVTTVTSGDTVYDGIAASDVNAVNTDDDSANVLITPSSGLITTEAGGTDSFTVVLTSQPTADVTINFASSDTSEGTVPAAITFTTANWNIAQTIVVTGVDDFVDDADIGYSIGSTVTSSDPVYNGILAAGVSVTNQDNDTAGVNVNPTSGLITTEVGGTAAFTVVLTSQPTADVTISLTSSDTSEGTVTAVITFTSLNWSTAQTVTITGVDDNVDDGDIGYMIVTTVTSSDPVYNWFAAADVSVTNTDDETAGISINPTSGLITTEAGGTAAFNVVLMSQPTADVTINFTSSDTSEGTIPAAITFTTANWNTIQTVTVTGVDDSFDDGDTTYMIVTAVTSSDALYNGINLSDVSVTNTDDETANVNINPTSGLITTETGGTAVFTVVLMSQPTADVTINMVSSDANEGTVPAAITFTSLNWNTPQTVTITGVDDSMSDGDTAYTIMSTVTSGDLSYNNIAVPVVNVTNTDDDLSGISVAPVVLTMTEESAPLTYQITVASTPSQPFTLAVTFDAAEVTVNGSAASPLLLTFTNGGAVNLVVDVIDQPNVNADRVTLITHTITTNNTPEYPSSLVIPGVTVFIGDAPPPPPSPTCDSENENPNAVVRTGIPDALAYAINCRVLYFNGTATNWLGTPLYSEANLGAPGLLDLGVQQAVDFFSPPPSNLTYFDGGAVFCLRGSGTLIWMAGSGTPRHPEIIGSYTVPEFSGFTCATLFEPGTLILVRDNPAD